MRLLLDEDFNNAILRGLLRRKSDIDVVRVQDVEVIAGAPDPEVLAWASQEGRIFFTHDASNMTAHAMNALSMICRCLALLSLARTSQLAQ